MTPKKATNRAANNLIQAFKTIHLDEGPTDSDIHDGCTSLRGPSGRWFVINSLCMESIDKATQWLSSAAYTYPREKLRDTVADVVIAAKDRGTPLEKAHSELSRDLLALLNRITNLSDWEVLHAIRGVQTYDQPFEIGRCQFSRMNKSVFLRWGQRFTTGKYNPPDNAPISQSWIDHQGTLLGQSIAVVTVQASDREHAELESRRVINESLDLLRYGQVTCGWPPDPVPEFGLAALSAYGYVQQQSACVRIDEFDMSTNKSIGAGEGASIEYCRIAPGWKSLERLLRIAPDNRTELQRRIMLALAWVGQAALASSLPVRLVAFTTALETLLINDSESLGKKLKLSTRVAAFPRLEQAKAHIGTSEVESLYKIRSECLHAGRTNVEDSDARIAGMAVAQCLCGILEQSHLREAKSLAELLTYIVPSGASED